MSFQENLKYYREKVNLSKAELARLLGLKYTTYNNYEVGTGESKSDIFVKIADTLNISLDDLLGRKEQSNDSLIKIRNKVMQEVNKQNRQWGDESELTPHQWLGLIQEEVGEIAQALNETYLPNKTKAKLAGKENIQAEIYQAAALLIRFSERIEGE